MVAIKNTVKLRMVNSSFQMSSCHLDQLSLSRQVAIFRSDVSTRYPGFTSDAKRAPGGDEPVTNEYGCEVFTQFLRNGINKKAAGFTGNSGVHRDQLVPERGIEPPTFSLRMSCSTD